eukprot:542133-Prorocentrum_minimum.AAC.2
MSQPSNALRRNMECALRMRRSSTTFECSTASLIFFDKPTCRFKHRGLTFWQASSVRGQQSDREPRVFADNKAIESDIACRTRGLTFWQALSNRTPHQGVEVLVGDARGEAVVALRVENGRLQMLRLQPALALHLVAAAGQVPAARRLRGGPPVGVVLPRLVRHARVGALGGRPPA